MHKNRLWFVLLTGMTVCTLFFSIRAAADLREYYRVSAKTMVSQISWEVREDGRLFIPHATYSFEVDGEIYSGSETLQRAWQRNDWSAEKEIEKLESYRWAVWYDADTPQISTLDRSFPWRELVYALVMIGLLIYFVGLGFYVGGLQNYRR